MTEPNAELRQQGIDAATAFIEHSQDHAQALNRAEWSVIVLLCGGYNSGPVGPRAWLCRLAWFTLWAGQPFDTDAAIAEHMDWLNKSENIQARADLAGCIEWLRNMAAKPRLDWPIPDNVFDLQDWWAQ